MKKAAGKSAVRWSGVVFAALFFFLAALSGTLWNMQRTFREKPEHAERLINMLYDQRITILSQNVLRPIFDSERETIKLPYPDQLNTAKTNFRFSVEDMIDSKTGEKLSTIENDESLQCVIKKKCPVNIHDASGDRIEYKTVICALDKNMEKPDEFRRISDFAYFGLVYHDALWAATVVLAALALLFCILALRGSVREASRTKGAQRFFSAMPPDLYLCCVLPAILILYKLLLDVYKSSDILEDYLTTGSGEYRFLLRPLSMAVLFTLFLILLVLFVYSLRRGDGRCLFAFWRFKQIPFARRTVIYLAVMEIVKIASVGLYLAAPRMYADSFSNPERFMRWAVLLLLLEKIITLPVIYRMLRQLRALMDKTAQFAEGDLSGTASDENDYATLRMHGADVDALAQRISETADEYIQSSNFKAELITNLSHDIKTPLTSIINYAHLLEKEDLTQADRKQYLEVLQRHSGRLQKLVDDLSEVSDAASGNVPVELTVVDLCAVVQQAVSGFEERLLKQNITIRFRLPKHPVYVAADSRLLQRVTDNLMNNICKYTRFGTEVQIAVVVGKYRIAAVFQNLSDSPMKLSGEKLLERFVRDDDVRQKEGSGLGLSIAQSLMHLQGGMLWVHVKDNEFTSQILFRKM